MTFLKAKLEDNSLSTVLTDQLRAAVSCMYLIVRTL